MKEIKKYISFPLKGIGLWEVLLVNAWDWRKKFLSLWRNAVGQVTVDVSETLWYSNAEHINWFSQLI